MLETQGLPVLLDGCLGRSSGAIDVVFSNTPLCYAIWFPPSSLDTSVSLSGVKLRAAGVGPTVAITPAI